MDCLNLLFQSCLWPRLRATLHLGGTDAQGSSVSRPVVERGSPSFKTSWIMFLVVVAVVESKPSARSKSCERLKGCLLPSFPIRDRIKRSYFVFFLVNFLIFPLVISLRTAVASHLMMSFEVEAWRTSSCQKLLFPKIVATRAFILVRTRRLYPRRW